MSFEDLWSDTGHKERSFGVGEQTIVVSQESVDPQVEGWPKQYHDIGVLFVAANQ